MLEYEIFNILFLNICINTYSAYKPVTNGLTKEFANPLKGRSLVWKFGAFSMVHKTIFCNCDHWFSFIFFLIQAQENDGKIKKEFNLKKQKNKKQHWLNNCN